MIASIDVELATCRVNDFFMQHYIIENDFVLINIWRYNDIRRFYIVYPTELDTSSKSNLKFKRLPVQVRGLQSRAFFEMPHPASGVCRTILRRAVLIM